MIKLLQSEQGNVDDTLFISTDISYLFILLVLVLYKNNKILANYSK